MTTPDEKNGPGDFRSDPVSLIENTDWAALEHAYGPAEGTPFDLLHLLDDDPATQAAGLGQLDMSVLHQGSLYSATAPAALFVAAILDDPRTLAEHESSYPWDDRVRPVRAALLEWLGQVAESAAYGEAGGTTADDHEPEYEDADVTDACRAVRPALYSAVFPFLADPHPAVREAAVGAVAELLKAPGLADRIPAAAAWLLQVLSLSTDRRERAAAVLSIGGWGQDTTRLLTDPDPAVRACAALAPGCRGDAQATQVILDALLDPAAADAWFKEPLPQFDGWFRFTLLAAAVERTGTFEELLPAALKLVPLANDHTVDSDWGPLLVRAFPDGFTPGRELTAAQRAFLRALVDKDDCWGNIGNKLSWLSRAGLPKQRSELAELVAPAR